VTTDPISPPRTRVQAASAYATDLAERVAATAGETFLATLVASGWFDVQGITDTSLLQKAGIAAIAAGLAVLKGAVAKWVGDRRSASLAPSVRA
jgi:hypothetical protein